MKIKEKTLVNIVFFLSLFPYFKLIPINAEIQPFAALFALILLLAFRRKADFQKVYSIYLFGVLGYLLVEICFVLFDDKHTLFSFAQSFAIIFSPLLIFIALKDRLQMVSTKMFMVAMTSWAVLGLFQKYLPSVLVATKVDVVLGSLISRWSAYDLSAIQRGVVMFSPEPSYAAHNILFMLLYSIFLYRDRRISQKTLIYSVFLFCLMVYLNLSSTMLFIAILAFVPYGVLFLSKPRNWILAGIAVLMIYLSLTSLESINYRPVQVMEDLMTSLTEGSINTSTLLQFESEYGSRRFGNTLDGYGQLFSNYGLGNGIGSWDRNFDGHKPYSYVSYVSSELGIFAFLCMLVMFTKMILKRYQQRVTVFSISCLASALFGLYFNSTPSLPLYWIALLLFYHEHVEPKKRKIKATKAVPTIINTIQVKPR